MSVDRSWLALTGLYAVVAVLGLAGIILSLTLLLKKVKRTAAAFRLRICALMTRQQTTASVVRTAGNEIGGSGKRLAATVRQRVESIARILKGIRV